MNLFAQKARIEQSILVTLSSNPQPFTNAQTSKQSWYCDCAISIDGVEQSIRAWHNRPEKPPFTEGQQVEITATKLGDSILISLPQV